MVPSVSTTIMFAVTNNMCPVQSSYTVRFDCAKMADVVYHAVASGEKYIYILPIKAFNIKFPSNDNLLN